MKRMQALALLDSLLAAWREGIKPRQAVKPLGFTYAQAKNAHETFGQEWYAEQAGRQ